MEPTTCTRQHLDTDHQVNPKVIPTGNIPPEQSGSGDHYWGKFALLLLALYLLTQILFGHEKSDWFLFLMFIVPPLAFIAFCYYLAVNAPDN